MADNSAEMTPADEWLADNGIPTTSTQPVISSSVPANSNNQTYQPQNTENIPHVVFTNPNRVDKTPKEEITPADEWLADNAVGAGNSKQESKFPVAATQTETTTDNKPPVLTQKQAAELKKTDPQAYYEQVEYPHLLNNLSEMSTGLGDYPRSIARTIAALPYVGPSAYNSLATGALARGYSAATGTEIPPTANALQQATEERNADFEKQYGNDPDANMYRTIGGLAPAIVGTGLASKVVGAGVNAATRAFPAVAQYVAESPTLAFLGGKFASDAVTNPATGAVEQGATLGNKAAQYMASGTNAALQAVPLTAQVNDSSNLPVGTQTGMNTVAGFGIGAGSPATYDAGVGIGNKIKDAVTPVTNFVAQNARNAFQKVVGAFPEEIPINTQTKVPGLNLTYAQAAKGNFNAAATERALAEASPVGTQAGTELSTKYGEQQNVLKDYLQKHIGTPQDIDAMDAAREAQRDANTKNLWKQNSQVDTQPITDKVNDILTTGKTRTSPAVQAAMADVKKSLIDPATGKPITDPETLYQGTRRSIAQLMKDKDLTKTYGQQASAELGQVLSTIDDTLETAAPGYKKYMSDYANASQDITGARFLHGYNLTDPNNPLTYKKVNNIIDYINRANGDEGYAGIAGVKGKAGQAKAVSDAQLEALKNVRDDLDTIEKPNRLLAKATQNSATDPKIEIRQKLKDALNSSPQSGVFSPSHVGTTLGGVAGGSLGLATSIPGAEGVGMTLGGWAGNKIGSGIERFTGKAAQEAENRLVTMFLNPQQATTAPGINYLKSFGQSPNAQSVANFMSPYIAEQYARARVGQGGMQNVSGAGNSQ